MTQKEYMAATLKIIGLLILIYGAVVLLPRNVLRGSVALYESGQDEVTYNSENVPEKMQRNYDNQNQILARARKMTAITYFGRIPVNIAVILLGLALIKRDRWFTTFLLGKNADE